MEKDPRELTQKSVNTIYKYSGQLNLLLQHISQMHQLQKQFELGGCVNAVMYGEKLINITNDIYDLIDKNPQLFNDMAFLKDIYNRKHYMFESGQLKTDQI
jgi:hypothetical protein